MENSELFLYPIKIHSAFHVLGMLKYSQFCDPARQKLADHLKTAALRGQNTRSAVLCSVLFLLKNDHK